MGKKRNINLYERKGNFSKNKKNYLSILGSVNFLFKSFLERKLIGKQGRRFLQVRVLSCGANSPTPPSGTPAGVVSDMIF